MHDRPLLDSWAVFKAHMDARRGQRPLRGPQTTAELRAAVATAAESALSVGQLIEILQRHPPGHKVGLVYEGGWRANAETVEVSGRNPGMVFLVEKRETF